MEDNDVVQVYVAPQPHQAHFLRNILADAGIEARVLGENLNLVDPPANLQSGALWVRQSDAEAARRILADWERSRSGSRPEQESNADWICATCGESVGDDFDVCWNCETQRPQA
jgi:hypothetical protein